MARIPRTRAEPRTCLVFSIRRQGCIAANFLKGAPLRKKGTKKGHVSGKKRGKKGAKKGVSIFSNKHLLFYFFKTKIAPFLPLFFNHIYLRAAQEM